MKARFSFRDLSNIVTTNPEFQGMEVIVEKELLHYELLHLLRRGGWLDQLVFQGGTALRLFHGSARLSEDLDFSGGPDFSAERMTGLAGYLEDSLSQQTHGLDVSVRSPKTIHRLPGEIGVSTWRIDIAIEPRQKHIPRQRVKIDIDNTLSYTKETRQIRKNYNELPDYNLMVHVQSEEEILAGKIVAFSNSIMTRDHPRYRDIWDMNWLRARTGLRLDLLDSKMKEYNGSPDFIERASSRVVEIVRSSAFTAEMSRFLLPGTVVETLDNSHFMDGLAKESERFLRKAAQGLLGNNEVSDSSPSP